MDQAQRWARSQVFGRVADVYDLARPGYPEEAVQWLVGPGRARILELGAGTGKLTARLVGRGHHVIASDPSAPMLRRLRETVSEARLLQARAEAIPLAASSVDVVVAAQSFHWFDFDAAVPEMARVLRPDGVAALVWNVRDDSIPWVRRLSKLIGADSGAESPEVLAKAGLFLEPEHRRFRFWQPIDREQLLSLVRSRSYIAAMSEADRSSVLEKVGELYDEYGRGADGMAMPYFTDCFRARVSGLGNYQRERTDWDAGLLVDFN